MPVNVIGTLKPKNNGKFPVAEAVDIKVTDDLRLDKALENKADLSSVNFALDQKADKTTTSSLQGQINQIVISSSAEAVVAPEVAAARVGGDGTEYETLKERLDAEQDIINNELEEISEAVYTVTEGSITWNGDSYINYENGNKSEREGYSSTDHIDISGQTFLKVKAAVNDDDAAGLAFYKNLVYVSGVKLISGTQKITIPDDATTVRFTTFTSQKSSAFINIFSSNFDKLDADIADIQADITDINSELNDCVKSTVTKTTFENDGYLKLDGTFKSDENWETTNYIEIIEDDYIKYALYQLESALSMIAFYDDSYTFISSISDAGTDRTVVSGTAEIPSNAKYFRATLRKESEGQYIKYKVEAVNSEEVDAIENKLSLLTDYLIVDNLAKPFTFTDSNIIGFGDSIMYGYRSTDPSDVTDNPWRDIFAEETGASNFTNRSVGGAGYARTNNSILAQMNGQTLSARDFIFVAAGTNDYHYAEPPQKFEEAVEDTFDYIDEHKGENTKVIIITPINRTQPPGNANSLPIEWYRDCITKKSLLHGYSVVDGSKMGFTNIVGSYQVATMADGLHPTDLGYQLYANYLLGLLL